RVAVDPQAAAALAVIAADEAGHAELGWAVLEWCAAAGGDAVRRVVVAARTDLAVPRVPVLPADLPADVADAHGRGTPPALARMLVDLHAGVLHRLDSLVGSPAVPMVAP
nr:hypothetical protein [Acidimicrobiia bacterium]